MTDAALAYLIAERPAYRDDALRQLEWMFDPEPWPEWRHPVNAERGVFADHRIGSHLRQLSIAYDWLHPALRPDQRGWLLAGIRERALQPVLDSRSRDAHWGNYNNWTGVIAAGMGTAGLAMEGEIDGAGELIEAAIAYQRTYLATLGPDGEFNESPAYAASVLTAIRFFESLRYHRGRDAAGSEVGLDPELRERVGRFGRWYAYHVILPCGIVPFGDCNPDARPNAVQIGVIAELCGDPVLRCRGGLAALDDVSPPAGIGAGDVRLAKFDPLPRVLFFDDFDEGINGWCELVGNHDNNLDNIRPLVRDLRPAQLSTCTFFDIGTHGSVDGVYSLKLATRPRVNHMNQLIKRVTYVGRGLVRLETWFTYKAETVFDPSLTGPKQWDGNYHPVEAMFGDFCFSNDVNDGPDGKRHHCALRYVNTDFEGNFVRKWMYKTSLQVTTKMQLAGMPTPTDYHTVHPDDWEDVPGGAFSLCHNEVPTKINWNYLSWTFDTAERRNVELRKRPGDGPARAAGSRVRPPVLWPRLLNFCIDVRTHLPVRNFLFLDSVLVSVDW